MSFSFNLRLSCVLQDLVRCHVLWTSILAWADSRTGQCGTQARRSKKVTKSPSPGHPRDHPHSPPPSLITEGIRGPFMKNTRWDVSPFPPKQQFSSEVKDKNRVCSHVYAYLCAYFRVCTECVWVCVCVYIYIRVKWPGQSWGCQANSVRGDRCPVLPVPSSFL